MAGVSVRALRRIPLARLLAAAEVLVVARQHYLKLAPDERRRFLTLIRRGRGRPSNLSKKERMELAALIAKAEPRLFAQLIVERLAGVKLPTGNRNRRRPSSQ